MSFRNQFERIRVFSNSGCSSVITYKPIYTDKGSLDLVESGKINVYEQIQSFKSSCDLKTILARFENGDVSALNQRLPYFGDFSEMPESLAGFLQLYADAEGYFATLDPDLRSKFNNSASEFFAQIGSDYFNQCLGIGVHESVAPSEPIVEKGDNVE